MRIVYVSATAVIAAALSAGCQARQSRPKPVAVAPVAGALRSSPPDEAPSKKPPKKPRPVIVEFHGAFTAKRDGRRVSRFCPGCKKELAAVRVSKCPGCKLPLVWSKGVKCGHCRGTGKCSTCKGAGKCPRCAKRPRMLMGVRQPCGVCNTTGRCGPCGGKGACLFCHNGWYAPGKAKKR